MACNDFDVQAAKARVARDLDALQAVAHAFVGGGSMILKAAEAYLAGGHAGATSTSGILEDATGHVNVAADTHAPPEPVETECVVAVEECDLRWFVTPQIDFVFGTDFPAEADAGMYDRLISPVKRAFTLASRRHYLGFRMRGFTDALRSNEFWPVIRPAWYLYNSLRRLGMSEDKMEDTETISALGKDEDTTYTTWYAWTDLYDRITMDGFVPTDYDVDGGGNFQTIHGKALLLAIQSADTKFRQMRDVMRDLPPIPDRFGPYGETDLIFMHRCRDAAIEE